MPEMTNTRGADLRAARNRVGMLQREVAGRAGLHVNTIKRLERFPAVPTSSWYALSRVAPIVGLQVSKATVKSRTVSGTNSRARALWGDVSKRPAGTVLSAPKGERPRPTQKPRQRCGARTRKGTPCQAPAMPNGRCKLHGGKSTGARTPEGRDRIRQAQLRRWQRARAEAAACSHVAGLSVS